MPDPILISPSGYIAQYTYPTYPFRGGGGSYSSVSPALPGGSTIARGVGEFDLTRVSAGSGSLLIQLITPSVATSAVAFLVNNVTTPTAYLGVALDLHLRPYAIITDVNGTVVGQTTPSGTFGAAGVPINILLSWNASTPIRGGFYALLEVGGLLVPDGDWSTPASAAWASFVPAALLLGVGNIGLLNDFAPPSSIVCVQLGPSVTRVVTDSGNSTLVADSTLAASANVAHTVTTSLVGGAIVTAALSGGT